jgi:hypothetical protein
MRLRSWQVEMLRPFLDRTRVPPSTAVCVPPALVGRSSGADSPHSQDLGVQHS